MNLENRVRRLEERAGNKEKGILVVINDCPPEGIEGLNELPEDVEEWLTFQEQMKKPKVQPFGNTRVFVKDSLQELQAQRLAQERKTIHTLTPTSELLFRS